MDKLSQIEVSDRPSFTEFLAVLYEDLLDNRNEWENATLDRFLEALVAYANDVQGYYDNTNQKINADIPSWKTFADILKGARVYE